MGGVRDKTYCIESTVHVISQENPLTSNNITAYKKKEYILSYPPGTNIIRDVKGSGHYW